MGISKRNPRGNFNWQSRYLKKKAVCCGQLNEPVDCDLNAPLLSIANTNICIPDPAVPHSMTCTNTRTGQATNTFYEWYKGSVVDPPYYSSYGPISTLTFAIPDLSLEDTWFVKATNEFGCVTIEAFEVYATNLPEFSVNVVYPAVPCSPDTGNVGDAEISVTLTNPDPNAVYYGYVITYGTNSVNPYYTYETTTVDTDFTWSGLCAGNYEISVKVYRLIDGVPTPLCNVGLDVQTGPLILTWDNISSTITVGVTDPNDIMQWRIAFFAFALQTVNVIGNQVFLYGPQPVNFYSATFQSNVSILGIEDYGRYLLAIGPNVFFGASNLSTILLPYVTTMGINAFRNAGPFGASFPNCISIGEDCFRDSAITDIRFAILTTIPNNAFRGTLSLSTYNFPIAVYAGIFAFSGSGIPDITFPLLDEADDECFYSLPNAIDVNCPSLRVLGQGSMGGNPLLGSVNPVVLPSLQSGLDDCLSTNAQLIELDLPNMTTAGSGAFQLNPSMTKINAPNLISLGSIGCRFDTALAIINFDSIVNIGPTTSSDMVFDVISPSAPVVTIKVPIAQQTADAGNLEGDLLALSFNRPSVIFIWT